MGPAIQKPLLPLRQAGGAGAASPPGPLGRRPGGGSQHSSPAKEFLSAVEHGDAGGVLRAASAACLRYPLLLLAAALVLVGVAGLAAWLLPQQPLPSMLAHVAHRGRSPRQRAFFEELTQQEQQLITAVGRPPPARSQQQQQAGAAASLDALALPRRGEPPTPRQQQQQVPGQPQLDQAQQQQQLELEQPQARGSDTAAAGNDSEPMFNIHKIAGVPQLFGDTQDRRRRQQR